MDSREAAVRSLARRLTALTSAELRAASLRHRLLRMSPAAVADLVMITINGAEARDRELSGLLPSLSLALADPACKGLRELAGQLLVASGQQALAALVWEAAAPEPNPEQTQRVPDFGRRRPLALGERKSLARRQDRDLITRVVRDPHPDVIRILLGNPAVTETDVLRLCARRPAPPDVLRQVFQSPRWIVRYTIKAALALNPYAPLDVRLQLTPLLTRRDIDRILAQGSLPPALEQACHRMVQRPTIH